MQLLQSNDLTIQQRYRALSILLVGLLTISLVCVYFFTPLESLFHHGAATNVSCIGFAIAFVYGSVIAYRMGLPAFCYGFSRPKMNALLTSLVLSLIFCGFVLVIKFLLIHYDASFKHLSVIQLFSSTVDRSTLLWYLLLYSLFAPIQAIFFHGYIEGPLIDLLDIRARALICIILATLFFDAAHLAIGLYLAILVFIPVLYWCILYYIHRCLWAIALSHILIGGVLMFVVGVDPFLTLIKEIV